MDIKSKIRVIEGFPKDGISFKDITTLLLDPVAYDQALQQMMASVADMTFDYIIGPEARGYIFAAPMAIALKKGFIPVRKPGKLPAKTASYQYDLEYGSDAIEIHEDAIQPGVRVLIVDDLLATGGTAHAVAKLVEQLGGVVAGFSFLIELDLLNAREELSDYDVRTVIHYEE